MAKKKKAAALVRSAPAEYGGLVTGIADLLEQARRGAARAVNSILTATYWEVGRRIVEFEQGGQARAVYGEELLKKLAQDLTARFGRGFSKRNLELMRVFYLGWEIAQTPSAQFEARARLPLEVAEAIFQAPSGISQIRQTPSAELPSMALESEGEAKKRQTPSAVSETGVLVAAFPLSWSHYVRLMSVEKPQARVFYESEAIRGGWSVRQLDRQIGTQFFERASRSKQQAALLARDQKPKPEDADPVDDVIRDPYLAARGLTHG